MSIIGLISPFTNVDSRKFNNTNRLARVLYRFKLYSKILLASHGKVPVAGLVRKQFPFLLPDASAPPALSVELTNYCNLACPYSSPLKLRPQGMMDPVTFSNLLWQVKEYGIRWIALVGNGEPTLQHPKFAEYVCQLGRATKFLSVTTNWHRVDEEIAYSVLQAPVNLINISVDGGNKQEYESQRIGGNFERLLQNLTLLNRLKKRRGLQRS